MGIFDRFKKQTGNSLIEKLKALYALEKKAPYEASIVDDWWEGKIDRRAVAFQERGAGVIMYVGKVEEITEIYLVRSAAGQPVQAGASLPHLERIAGEEGKALAAQFDLGAAPQGPFDFPQLRLPSVRDGIPRLSSSVREVAIFESYRGISIATDHTASVETVAEDLKLAFAMLEALEAAA